MKTCQISSKQIQKEIVSFKSKKYILLKTSPFQKIDFVNIDNLELVGDNTKKNYISKDFSKQYLFFGHYRNLLTLYQSLKKNLNETIPVVNPLKIQDSYQKIVILNF